MEITHAKGLMYPALQLSSFRVRRDNLPPAFDLPEEISRAVEEPLPELRSVALEEKALRNNRELLKEDEKEQKLRMAFIAEEASLKEELARVAQKSKSSDTKESAEKARKVRELKSIMGEKNTSVVEARLEESGWDLEKATISFLDGGNG